jgi:hypothetical protein
MDRSNWTLNDYIEELDRLHSFEKTMDEFQFKQLEFYLEQEIKQKFDASDREKFSLKF